MTEKMIDNKEVCKHCGLARGKHNADSDKCLLSAAGEDYVFSKTVSFEPADSSGALERPDGAIHNGIGFMDRLENHYKFKDEEGHSLENCHTWHEVRRCFNTLINYISVNNN